jgi:hypothetical protein
MDRSPSTLNVDILLHILFFVMHAGVIAVGGFHQGGLMPPMLYPGILVLAVLTLHRQHTAQPFFQTRLILIPSVFAVFVIFLCLLSEMHSLLWGFRIVSQFPVWVRVVWAQSVLLLLHPGFYPIVTSAGQSAVTVLRERGYFNRKLMITMLFFGLIMWLLRSQNIYSDGYDWIKHSTYPVNWTRYLREPLAVFLMRLSVLFGGWQPYLCITLLMIGSGIVSTWLIIQVFRDIVPRPYRTYCLALLISSAGYTQLFFGNIEIYGLLQLGLVFFLFSVVRYWRGRWPVWSVGLVYGLFLCLHLSSVWWGLCFLAIPWIKEYGKTNTRNILAQTGMMCGSAMAVSFAFALFVAQVGYQGNLGAMIDHFFSDQVLYVGSDGAMFHPWHAYLSWPYYLEQINEYFFLMPWFFPFLALLILGWKYQQTLTWEQCWFVGLCIFYAIYSVLWHADRPLSKDWDIFSGLTIPTVLTMGYLLMCMKIKREAKTYLFYQLIIFAGAYLIMQILFNHLEITPYWIMEAF